MAHNDQLPCEPNCPCQAAGTEPAATLVLNADEVAALHRLLAPERLKLFEIQDAQLICDRLLAALADKKGAD